MMRAFSVVLIVIMALLLTGCVSKSTAPEALEHSRVVPGYALKAFIRKNSKCQLMTDWQTMCSRIDERGGVNCQVDPINQVEPSAPFCVDNYLNEYMDKAEKEMESILRFCKTTSALNYPNKKLPLCETFVDERPFNGKSVSSIAHPWCSEWSTFDGSQKVCGAYPKGMNGTSSLVDCSSVDLKNRKHHRPLICTNTNLPEWCAAAWVNDVTVGLESGDEIYFGNHPRLAPPVFGLHCRQTSKSRRKLNKLEE